MFRLAPALLSKSQQCQTAPCGLGWRLLAQHMYLLKRSYNFLLYCFSPHGMTELLHQDPIQSTLKSVFLPFFQWSRYIYGPNTDTSTLCKQFGRTVLILPKVQICNDDFSDTGPDPALKIITGIS